MVSLPSQISAFCALAARSPCICSHLRVALRCAQQPTGLTLPSGALRVALPPPVASAHRAHASLRAFGRSQRSGKCCGIRLWGAEGKRRPRGLPSEAQSDPQVRRREVSALWAVAAKGGKATRRREQIQGLRAVSAQNADICERANPRLRAAGAHSADICGGSETMSAPEGSVSPVGCQAQRKATRRCAGGKCQPCGLLPPKAAKRPEGVSKYKGCARSARRTPIFANEQTQGLRAVSAHSADICERQGSANDGATDDPPAPRPLSTSCARPALPGGAFLCPFHSPRNVIHYTQPFFPAA